MNIFDTDGNLLFESDVSTIREAVEEAVKAATNLSRANLSGASLRGANLILAKLRDATVTDIGGLLASMGIKKG